MNREIKFRAWNKDQCRMWMDVQTAYDYMAGPDDANNGESIPATTFGEILRLEDEWIPMQFTGLHDKNGVEIYEGDQIELLNCSPRFWTVEMDQGCWCGIWRSEGVIDARCPVAELVADGARVIGNIHENPELLCN